MRATSRLFSRDTVANDPRCSTVISHVLPVTQRSASAYPPADITALLRALIAEIAPGGQMAAWWSKMQPTRTNSIVESHWPI